ncbi:MAG: arsenate reductase ArsC [Phycisphaerae bacterium]|nr:arsenate reductase ArsC [Phycisphaerae bacterium]
MKRKRHILFVCTGNCCRSQMAEAILARLGADRFVAHSAGSNPAGWVHPLVEAALVPLGIPVLDDARSKSWDEFENRPIDWVITLCDSAAREVPDSMYRCPVTHWSTPDPSFAPGTDEDRLVAAMRVAERLVLKIERLVALDFDRLDEATLQARLNEISQL